MSKRRFDQPLPSPGPADGDQTSSDADQTSSDADQASSDAEDALSRADQVEADREQTASERDQAAADLDHAGGPAAPPSDHTYDETRAQRKDASASRASATAGRSRSRLDRAQTATDRDATAGRRDLAALEREHAARRAARRLAESTGADDAGVEAFLTTSEAIRVQASADRSRATADREQAATNRTRVAADRRQAGLDLQGAQMEAVTGVYPRERGLEALRIAMARARRADESFVLACVDVDVDPPAAHSHLSSDDARDAVLLAVVDALGGVRPPCDPIVHVGPDGFLCGLTGSDATTSREEFAHAGATVAAGETAGVITVGVATLEDGDALEDLVARAFGDVQTRGGPRG